MLRWKVIKNITPTLGTVCVVGHFDNSKLKPVMGVWKFICIGGQSYWQTKAGRQLQCNFSDHWCDVEDIIESVASRVEDEIRPYVDECKIKNNLWI